MVDYKFDGRIALVVGGGGGSGREFCLQFGAQGGCLVVADFNDEAASETVRMVTEAGGKAVSIKVNVVEEAQIKAAVQLAVDTYGGLDFAINLVGTSMDFCPLTEVPSDHFDSMMQICTRGVFYGMKYEIPAILKTGRGGCIVNMGSNGSLIGHENIGVYDACKHAVLGMSKSAALDFAKDGIRVNVICPGTMLSTNLKKYLEKDPHFADKWVADIPTGKMQTYEEIAGTYMFLCSDFARSITGVALPVDGGQVAH